MGLEQKLCEEKIFEFQSKLNAIICIGKMFAVKISGVFLALIFKLCNKKIMHCCIQKNCSSLQDMYFWGRSIHNYDLVVKASCRRHRFNLAGCWSKICIFEVDQYTGEGKLQETLVQSSRVLKISAPPWPFCMALSQSVDSHVAALSIIFLFLNLVSDSATSAGLENGLWL